MRPFISSLILLTLFSCASVHQNIDIPEPVKIYGGIFGTVIEDSKNTPVADTKVIILDSPYQTTTDSLGRYHLYDLPEDTYSIQFIRSKYDTLTIKEIDLKNKMELNINIKLKLSERSKDANHHYYFDPYKIRASDKQSINDISKKPGSELEALSPEYEIIELPLKKEQTTIDKLKTDKIVNEPKPALQAGSHNDNEEYPYFLDFLTRFDFLKNVYPQNFQDRKIVRVIDQNGLPLHHVEFRVLNWLDLPIWEAHTYANGENVLFPNIMFPQKPFYNQKVEVITDSSHVVVPLDQHEEPIITIQVSSKDKHKNLSLDLLFAIDATGSMDDEIQQLKDTIYSIHHRIQQYFSSLQIRFGLILYRDRKDEYTVKPFPFTGDIDIFEERIHQVKAAGGGDHPEDIQAALQHAIQKLDWNPEAIKLMLLIGDARPHLDYGEKYDYIRASLDANKKGIKIFTIGASGLEADGEYIFRQIAALTYGEYIFLTYGEQEDSDVSPEAKVSHHTGSNYQTYQLDDLIVNLVKKEVSYQIPATQLTINVVEPEEIENLIEFRLDNLWLQIKKQLKEFMHDKPVGILCPFQCEETLLKNTAKYLHDQSMLYLVNDQEISLVERERLEEILSERNLQLSGLIKSDQLDQVSMLLGANCIFVGELNRSGMDQVVFLRAINVKNSEIIAAARVRI